MACRRVTVGLSAWLPVVLAGVTAAAQQRPATPQGYWQHRAQPAAQPARAPIGPVLGPYRRPPYRDEPEEDAASKRRSQDPRYLHDGIYFRYAAGLGAGFDYVEAEGAEVDFRSSGSSRGDISGFAAATEVALGGTPFPGMVVGGSIYTVTMPSSDASIGESRSKYDFATSQLALFSPFVDYYVFPRVGLHFQGAVGLAVFIMGQGNRRWQAYDQSLPIARAHTAKGIGFMLGMGYDWWVAEQWSIGLLGRLLWGWTKGLDPDGVDWDHHSGGYTALLTVTHH